MKHKLILTAPADLTGSEEGRKTPLFPGHILTQPADGAVVGLVAQGVSAGIAQAEVSAGQNEGVAEIRQANHTLVAVVTVLVI